MSNNAIQKSDMGNNKPRSSSISEIKRICKNILKPSPKPKTTSFSTPSLSLPSSPSPSLSSSYTTQSLQTTDSKNDDIEKVFQYIDENGDGKISAEELQRCVKAVGAQRLSIEEAAAAVECSDSDGDGFLSLGDFEELMGATALSEEEKTAELREAYVMFSDKKDGTGVITPKSLKKMLRRLGEYKSNKECIGMIQVYDVDGDGVLCFQEFVAMMS
ncbi:hypothetical protein RND81_10G187300 [Saponaria officinalis]|uniref:EF-hand domain-containing protein n=1 Tax=Saponaria officinalis TaxID=3572 RepID=A0AAW1I4F4_SAPOF